MAQIVLTSILAFLAGILFEFYKNRCLVRKAQEDLRIQRSSERIAFQRETLLRLQEAGAEFLEATAVWLEARDAQFQQTGHWPAEVADESSRKARRKARLEVHVLLARVENDELRQRGEHLLDLSSVVLAAKSYEDAKQALDNIRSRFKEGNDVLGAVLRDLLKATFEFPASAS